MKLTVPAGASSGRKLRLRGRGLKGEGGKRGDQYVELRIMLPPVIDDELESFIRRWHEAHPYDPRADKGRGR